MKQRTEAQREASRRNGAKSNGPVTTAGKKTSSQNAVKHGFTAAITLLPDEEPEAFEAYFQSQLERFAPQNDAEFHLVRDLSAAAWRLRAINNAQIDVIACEAAQDGHIPNALFRLGGRGVLPLLIRYTASLQRQYTALLKELADIPKSRKQLRNEPEKTKQPISKQSRADQPEPGQPTPPVLMNPDPGVPQAEPNPAM